MVGHDAEYELYNWIVASMLSLAANPMWITAYNSISGQLNREINCNSPDDNL